MRKHFLILMLLTLLPFTAWAQTADLEDADVSFSHIQYGGGFPVMQVLYKGQVLTQNTHFTWDGKYYTDAACETVATTPLAVTTGDQKYYVKLIGKEGTVYENSETTGWFTVEPADLKITAIDNVEKNFNGSYSDIEVSINDITFNGFVLEQGANVLTVADHIYVQYGNGTAINAGEYTITGVTGISSGNYNISLGLTGENPSKATINPIAFPANAFAITASTVTYSAAAATLPTVTTALTDDDYTLAWYDNEACTGDPVAAPTNAGSYYAKITGIGNYNLEANAVTFDAAKLIINRKAVMAYVQNKEKVYDGEAIDLEEEGNVPEIVFNGLYAADAEVKDNFEVTWVTEPGDGGYVDAGEYAMVPAAENEPDADGIIDGIPNYTFNLLETGFYAITKRPVTVTAKNQSFIYTGEAQAISTEISDETVAITASTATTGLVEGDDLDDIDELFTISLKNGVTILEKTNSAYTGAILINPDAEAIAESNYTIVPVAGNVLMGGQALILIAGTYSKEYGYALNKNDISVVNSANLKAADWKVAPTFSVTKDGVSYDNGAILEPGTYITAITNASAIVPDNYTNAGTAEDLYTGELTITKREIEITINQVNLNAGATVEDLNRYASVADYSNQLVNAADKADIDEAIVFAFADGVTGEGDVLQAAADYAENESFNEETSIYTAGVVAAEIENDLYDISFVAGNIKIGAAGSLVLDPTDPQLSLKIDDAAAAYEADETEFAVSFANLTMKANEWYAMVLPFDIDPKEMVYAADRYVIFNELNKAKTTNSEFKFTLKFDKIEAGTPFLIKFAGEEDAIIDWADFNFEDNSGEVPVAMTFAITGTPKEVATDYVTFKGTYSGIKLQGSRTDGSENYVWWLCDTNYKNGEKGNNWLKPVNNARDLKPMEAYLDGNESTWTGYAPKITVEDFDGSVTSIKSISADEIHGMTAKGMYNLNGMKMNSVPTQKGVYIVNGKKVVIK